MRKMFLYTVFLKRLLPVCLFFFAFCAAAQNKADTTVQAAIIAASLDDRVLAAQVIMTGIDGRSRLSPAMKDLLRDIPAGALMLFKYNLNTGKDEVRSFLAECNGFVRKEAGIAPFIAADHEGGYVHRFGPGVERLPAASHWWDLAQKSGKEAALAALEQACLRSGKEIRSLGLNINLAPVAEILDDKNRIFLDTRSFGPDPEFTAAAAAAFVRGMGQAGIGCVLKHFPGNSAADPHSALSSIDAAGETVDAMVRPFAELSGQGTGVMVSHALVPARDPDNIASLSPLVMREWLRKELGFEGPILADDFSMGAAAQAAAAKGLGAEEAAVASIIAGADMVMAWPKNLRQMHRAILNALSGGRLSRERLLDAAGRIIAAKIYLGVIAPEEY